MLYRCAAQSSQVNKVEAFQMFVLGLLLAVLAASVSSNEIVKPVGDKWSRVIFCPSTYGFCKGPQDYKFSAASGEPIKIFCPDFRTAPCSIANVTFNDGQSDVVKCGEPGKFQIVTNSSEVTAKLGGVGGFVDCSAKTIHSPRDYTELNLTTSEVQKIDAPKRFASEQTDNAWKFTTTDGNKLSLACFTKLEKKVKSECVQDILTINNGESTTQHCGRGSITAESAGTELIMRLETYQATEGHISCTVRAIQA